MPTMRINLLYIQSMKGTTTGKGITTFILVGVEVGAEVGMAEVGMAEPRPRKPPEGVEISDQSSF